MNYENGDDDNYLIMVGGNFMIGGGDQDSGGSGNGNGNGNATSLLSNSSSLPAAATSTTSSEELLTDQQERVLSLLFVLSGLLSIMGSLIIIYKILFKKMLRPIVTRITINNSNTKVGTTSGGLFRQHQRRQRRGDSNDNNNSSTGAVGRRTHNNGGANNDKSGITKSSRTTSVVTTTVTTTSSISTPTTTPYDRIMLGLSIYDVIASFTFVITPFMGLKEESMEGGGGVSSSSASSRIWSIGNATTCSTLGFLQQLSFGAVWYNCMLSYYYLATIKFGMKRHIFAQRVELYVHICTTFYFFLTAIFGNILGFYSEVSTGMGCWGKYSTFVLCSYYALFCFALLLARVLLFQE